jgi:hypothetical protein
MTTSATLFDAGENERADPMNEALDAFESIVRLLLASGHEIQMRARLERLIPKPAVTSGAEIVDEPVDLLETRMLIDACKHSEKIKMDGRAHNARKRMLAQAEKDLERGLKALRARA